MKKQNSQKPSEMTTGFPTNFLLQILHKFACCLIPAGLIAFLISKLIEAPNIPEIKIYWLIGGIFAGLGAIYYAFYANFLIIYEELYQSYKVRRPAALFITLFAIILGLFIADAIGFILLCGPSSPKLNTAITSMNLIIISSFTAFFFIVELIYTFVLHKRYSCPRCNLTGVGQEKNTISNSKWKEFEVHSSYTQSDKYNVNVDGVDVKVTCEKEVPTTHYYGSGTVKGTNVYHCRLCGCMIQHRDYQKRYSNKYLYKLNGGE